MEKEKDFIEKANDGGEIADDKMDLVSGGKDNNIENAESVGREVSFSALKVGMKVAAYPKSNAYSPRKGTVTNKDDIKKVVVVQDGSEIYYLPEIGYRFFI